ncbi:ABC transporter permease [Apilactobacillus quenuiae]|uniref:ABC transporter permease n=1 Tax=Apilactobacillus quenuiae TaxID=2008377 RepID=UPI000D01EC83|nr:ABC transporter permease [Apilactobacillus quenuiae]
MLTLLRQEIYKQIHGKFYIGWPIVMLLMSLIGGYFISSNKHGFSHNGFAENIFSINIEFALIAMVVFSSTIMIGDFANNTVKYLFSRQFSRLQIFISKLVTTFFMYIYLIVMSYIFTFITKIIFASSGDFGMKYILQDMFGISWFLLLLLPMVMLVSNIVKNNGVAIALGILFFFASSIINPFSMLVMKKFEILKFNPINFLNINVQFTDHTMKAMTHLSLTSMEIGIVIYALIFTAIAYVIYNHRNV